MMSCKSEFDNQVLGSVLVTVGCGFLGSYIVELFLKVPSCTSISALSRNFTPNLQPGVNYHSCDVANEERFRILLSEIQPQVIIHSCSPVYSSDPAVIHKTTVLGT